MPTASTFPSITHLGAVTGVTGSCHLVRANGLNILVDCGSAQGGDTAFSMDDWPVKPSDIDYVFLTHAHIDHTGRLPELIKAGFRGEILTTHPTKVLLLPMMEDAMNFSHMAENEIVELNKAVDDLTWGFEYGESFDLKNGIRFMLRRAGHILGSCFLRLESSDPSWSVIFSGDIGGGDKPLLPDPDPPDPCDLLIMEATYGDTIHEGKEHRIERLGAVLTRALSDRGKVYIPSFALGRTQELIYEMDRIAADPKLRKAYPALDPESKIPVFLDSPLGRKITDLYLKLAPFWDREARKILRSGDNPLDMQQLYAAPRHKEHLQLVEAPGPCIIIAGSGMCAGGRIVDHLKAGIEDPANDIVFVGYQAEGTLGRQIVEYAGKPGGYVDIDGQRFVINAKVHVLTGYSAHADQEELIAWVRTMPEKPGRIRLIHGEPAAKKALADRLRSLGYTLDETG